MHHRPKPLLTALLLAATLLSAGLCAHAQPATVPTSPAEIRKAIQSQLPPPPEGFVWKLYRNAVFLQPAKWFERERAGQVAGIPTIAYAASPEMFTETKPFEMGLTIQILDGPHKVLGVDANKMALAYLKPFMDLHKPEDILRFEQNKRGDFDYTFFRYRDAPKGLKPIIVHKFLLANNVTDTVHVFTFESPEASWDENWKKYGTPFLGKVNVMPHVPIN
jgi:hypothetical protein